MKNRKGQGTTEYLIILAIVIVIALVVVGVLGGFPSLGAGVSQGQSVAYWGSVSPLAVIEWSVPESGTGSLVFQNQTANSITLTDVNWNSTNVDITDVTIGPGSTSTATSTSFTCGVGVGQTFSRSLAYTYNTTNLTGLVFTGVTEVVGNCQ